MSPTSSRVEASAKSTVALSRAQVGRTTSSAPAKSAAKTSVGDVLVRLPARTAVRLPHATPGGRRPRTRGSAPRVSSSTTSDASGRTCCTARAGPGARSPVRHRHGAARGRACPARAAPATRPPGGRGADHRDPRGRRPPPRPAARSPNRLGVVAGRQRLDVLDRAARPAPAGRTSATRLRSAAAAAERLRRRDPRARRRTTAPPAAADDDRTSVVLPDPAAPVTSTPRWGGRAEPGQRLGVVEPEVQPLLQLRPPGTAARAGRRWPAAAPPPARTCPRPRPPARGVALPVVEAPSRQPTTVPIVTSAGPSGSVPVTVSNVVVQAMPIAVDRLRGPRRRPATRRGGVLGQQRDVVPGGDDLAEQRLPQHGRAYRRHRLRGSRHDDVACLPQRAGEPVPVSPSRTPRLPSSRSSQSTSPRSAVGHRGDGTGGPGADQLGPRPRAPGPGRTAPPDATGPPRAGRPAGPW